MFQKLKKNWLSVLVALVLLVLGGSEVYHRFFLLKVSINQPLEDQSFTRGEVAKVEAIIFGAGPAELTIVSPAGDVYREKVNLPTGISHEFRMGVAGTGRFSVRVVKPDKRVAQASVNVRVE